VFSYLEFIGCLLSSVNEGKMQKPRTIVVTVPGMIGDSDLAELREYSEVEYKEIDKVDEERLAALCDGFDYLMLNYDVVKKLSEQFYANAPVKRLKAIAADITGMDWSSPAGARREGVTLLNIPHYSTESVAESILSEILLHSRQRHSAYEDEIKGRPVVGRKGFNLRGSTAGVVGAGSIGSRVAELLSAIGMRVILWNRTPLGSPSEVSLEELFKQSKVICVCLRTVTEGPEKNVNIIGDRLLSLCRGTVIVNLANDQLVDHRAMERQIELGGIIGYSADRDKALLESSLAKLDSVHLPPANAWSSDESLDTLRKIWVDNVVAAIKGFPQNVYMD
jgi:phosphoglycerate dehydrogenase-like enzyme